MKQFAVDKLLEVTKLTEKSGISLTQQTNVVGAVVATEGGSLLEKLRKAADEVLYRDRKGDVVEAEVVEVKVE